MTWARIDRLAACALAFAAAAGCRAGSMQTAHIERVPAVRDAGAPRAAADTAPEADAGAPPAPPLFPPPRQGSSVARSADGARLYVADEDHHALRVLRTSDAAALLDTLGPVPPARLRSREIPLPGRPAQIVVTADRVLVTVRDPGMLLSFRDPEAGRQPGDGSALVETGRASVPQDAWGVAVDARGQYALVTSAWTHRVTRVDLDSMKARWSVDVPREPRGVVVRPDGAGAYVSHLTSAQITRLARLDAPAPVVRDVDLPAAPLRREGDTPLEASLGWSLALSADGSRLFAPRHALGAVARDAWFGVATVDVLLTASDTPLADPRPVRMDEAEESDSSDRLVDGERGPIALGPLAFVTQPRAVALRRSSGTLLVVGEGDATLAELHAGALDPSLAVASTRTLRGCDGADGVALSGDERVAYVYCAANFTLAAADLGGGRAVAATLADDPLPPLAAAGRRAFFDATTTSLSGGLACDGCHPEGRDDGHVWREITTMELPFDNPGDVEPRVFVGGPHTADKPGMARQTPMLAGRVDAAGPYGWHAEDPDLQSRIMESTHLHRWRAPSRYDERAVLRTARELAAFLRQGLVPPPARTAPLTPLERRGEALFEGEARCTMCHVPSGGFTDRSTAHIRWPSDDGFAHDPAPFRVPSLRFVSGTAPYYHDGSAGTLEQLLEEDDDRMGHTSQLTDDDREALAAYLRTL